MYSNCCVTAVPINLVRSTFFSERSHDHLLSLLRHAVQPPQIIHVQTQLCYEGLLATWCKLSLMLDIEMSMTCYFQIVLSKLIEFYLETDEGEMNLSSVGA